MVEEATPSTQQAPRTAKAVQPKSASTITVPIPTKPAAKITDTAATDIHILTSTVAINPKSSPRSSFVSAVIHNSTKVTN